MTLDFHIVTMALDAVRLQYVHIKQSFFTVTIVNVERLTEYISTQQTEFKLCTYLRC